MIHLQGSTPLVHLTSRESSKVNKGLEQGSPEKTQAWKRSKRCKQGGQCRGNAKTLSGCAGMGRESQSPPGVESGKGHKDATRKASMGIQAVTKVIKRLEHLSYKES